MNPEDPSNSLFSNSDAAPSCPPLGFPIPLSEKLQVPLTQALGVPQGTPTRRMILKMLLWGCRSSWVQCWPLLADTQQHLDLSSQSCVISGKSLPVCSHMHMKSHLVKLVSVISFTVLPLNCNYFLTILLYSLIALF